MPRMHNRHKYRIAYTLGRIRTVPQAENSVNSGRSKTQTTQSKHMAGTLYLVTTPIGNLDDFSPRGIETLRRVELIACEDTRTTKTLLDRFRIHTRTVSYHEHNEQRQTPVLLTKMVDGDVDIALVSDAGTPSISDPGIRLVRAARVAGCTVRAIPGPSAVTTALAVSGLASHHFTFLGFLPAKGAARTRAIESLSRRTETTIIFESARRLPKLLVALASELGTRQAFVGRELTKRYEQHRLGQLDELAQWAAESQLKGEITLVIGPKETTSQKVASSTELTQAFQQLTKRGMTRRQAVKHLAKLHQLDTRELYRSLLES